MANKIKCFNCSKEVDKGDLFCRHCGNYLGTEPVEKYICNKCGHLSYFDLVQDPDNPNIERCMKCREGLRWVKDRKEKESKNL